MIASDFDSVIARIEQKLAQHGFTEREASLKAVGKPDLIRDMRRRRGLPTSERLARLASLLGTTSDWLLHGGPEGQIRAGHAEPGRGRVLSEVRSAGIADPRLAQYGDRPLPALMLLDSAVGGEYLSGDGVDLIELQLGEILDYLARPASLADDHAAYALTVISDSMAPRFEPGERIAVSPRAPIAIGDDVIVQLKGDGQDQDADRVVQVLVKRLVRRSASFVELRQFNPDRTFTVPAERIAALHKVAGRIF